MIQLASPTRFQSPILELSSRVIHPLSLWLGAATCCPSVCCAGICCAPATAAHPNNSNPVTTLCLPRMMIFLPLVRPRPKRLADCLSSNQSWQGHKPAKRRFDRSGLRPDSAGKVSRAKVLALHFHNLFVLLNA